MSGNSVTSKSFKISSASVIGGKLKLKGSKKQSSSSGKLPKTTSDDTTHIKITSSIVAEKLQKLDDKILGTLTDSERRHRERKFEADAKAAKQNTQNTYRDRIEKFNSMLSSMTEHNDIPRISAAGNG